MSEKKKKRKKSIFPVIFDPELRELTGSLTSFVLLSKLIFLANLHNKNAFFQNDKNIMKETGLTKNELSLAKKKLNKTRFVTITKEGNPARTYYNLDKKHLKNEVKKLKKRSFSELKSSSLVNLNSVDYISEINKMLYSIYIINNKKELKSFSLEKDIFQNPKGSASFGCLNLDFKEDTKKKIKKLLAKKREYEFLVQSLKSKNLKSKNIVPRVTQVKNKNKERSSLYKKCYKIWIDNDGKKFGPNAIAGPNYVEKHLTSLFSTDRNPYYKLCKNENIDLRKKVWSLDDFEQAVKNYKGDSVTLDRFIINQAFAQNMRPRSRLLESYLDLQNSKNKFDFKGKHAETANFILRFYRNQIGDPDKVNPGVFVNAAKQIKKIEEKYIANPNLSHPGNQLWYIFMEYVKREIKSNDRFLPAFMSSDNFSETFTRKAIKNGALIDRQKGQWH